MMCSSWKTHLRGSEAPPSAKEKPAQTLKRRQRASSRFAAQKKSQAAGHAPSFMLPTSLVMLDGPALIVGNKCRACRSYGGVGR